MINKILRLEGLAILSLTLYTYSQISGNWVMFLLLLFLPDVSMIGYLKDKKLGALVYNIGHSYILALLFIFIGLFTTNHELLSFGIILCAHVSLDRFLGFGLKYESGFKDTHIQKV